MRQPIPRSLTSLLSYLSTLYALLSSLSSLSLLASLYLFYLQLSCVVFLLSCVLWSIYFLSLSSLALLASLFLSLSSRFSLSLLFSLSSPLCSLFALFALFSLFSFISLLSFNVDEKCESLRIMHSLWRRSVQKEIGYDPGCEHPHFPSAVTKTASFALVSRDPDTTSLLLLRMYYVYYTLFTYNSSSMHATSLHTLNKLILK